MKGIKIVLTGGHAASTAIATVQEILARKLDWKLFWIGPKTAIEGKKTLSAAFENLPQYGVFYYPLISGRLQKKWTRYTVRSLIKVPVGFFHSLYLLVRIRPNLILSFGGYAALPVVVIGWSLGIPVVIHSQTVAYGLANKLSTFFAKKIALARIPDNIDLPKNKTFLVGNPVMKEILEISPKKTIAKRPTVYITGGSTGSQVINELVRENFDYLLANYNLIHQTGEADYEYFEKTKKSLGSGLGFYEVFKFTKNVADCYKRADIIVSRAGANTISEILISGRPAILIPHPWVNLDEQNKNASLVSDSSQFVVLNQLQTKPETFRLTIDKVKNDWPKMIRTKHLEFIELDKKAAGSLVNLVEGCLN